MSQSADELYRYGVAPNVLLQVVPITTISINSGPTIYTIPTLNYKLLVIMCRTILVVVWDLAGGSAFANKKWPDYYSYVFRGGQKLLPQVVFKWRSQNLLLQVVF